MKIEIECSEMIIPLRYYKGWIIEFRVKTERFDCPFLSLFGFLSVPDLEKAIDSVLERRNKG